MALPSSHQGWYVTEETVPSRHCSLAAQKDRSLCPAAWPCYPQSACLGMNTCAATYSGVRCADCSDSGLRVGAKCPSCETAYYALAFLAVLSVLCACCVWQRRWDKTHNPTLWVRVLLSVDFLQIVAILAVALTSEATSPALDALIVFNWNPAILVNNCWGQRSVMFGILSTAERFEVIFHLVNMLPVLVAVVLLVLCFSYMCLCKKYNTGHAFSTKKRRVAPCMHDAEANTYAQCLSRTDANDLSPNDPTAQADRAMLNIMLERGVISAHAKPPLQVSCWNTKWVTKQHMDHYLIALAVCLSLLYCLLVQNALSVFDCRTTDPDDSYAYIAAVGTSVEGRCYGSSSVQGRLVPWSFAALIMYGIGIPLVVYYTRRRLFSAQMSSTAHNSQGTGAQITHHRAGHRNVRVTPGHIEVMPASAPRLPSSPRTRLVFHDNALHEVPLHQSSDCSSPSDRRSNASDRDSAQADAASAVHTASSLRFACFMLLRKAAIMAIVHFTAVQSSLVCLSLVMAVLLSCSFYMLQTPFFWCRRAPLAVSPETSTRMDIEQGGGGMATQPAPESPSDMNDKVVCSSALTTAMVVLTCGAVLISVCLLLSSEVGSSNTSVARAVLAIAALTVLYALTSGCWMTFTCTPCWSNSSRVAKVQMNYEDLDKIADVSMDTVPANAHTKLKPGSHSAVEFGTTRPRSAEEQWEMLSATSNGSAASPSRWGGNSQITHYDEQENLNIVLGTTLPPSGNLVHAWGISETRTGWGKVWRHKNRAVLCAASHGAGTVSVKRAGKAKSKRPFKLRWNKPPRVVPTFD